ncbi:MAG: type II toxin-antitoxin system PemK/MazF family toxin [Deltaproteobacteria bacterium]|nr:type II toxin-antitoxin system PemK/MazF family toxin [Deltaproteobacteria bacterium]
MKGKVVLVPFPFDDLSGRKVRPAVCLTDPVGPHRHVVLAFITSRIPAEPIDSDVILLSTDAGFRLTGLRVSSTLQLHRLMTVSHDLLLRELGKLPSPTRRVVTRKLRKLFGL